MSTNLAIIALIAASRVDRLCPVHCDLLPGDLHRRVGRHRALLRAAQFEDTYWNEHKEWDYATAAIRGSSYFKLNPVSSGLPATSAAPRASSRPRIPNYNLKRCHDENELFHDVTVLTLAAAVKTCVSPVG